MKKLFLCAALALSTATLAHAGGLAEPVDSASSVAISALRIDDNGCAWRKADNGNYFVRVDAGCKVGFNGNGEPRPVIDEEEPGCEPGKDEGGGEEGGEAA